MDSVVVVLDVTKDPYSQVNITIIGKLAVYQEYPRRIDRRK